MQNINRTLESQKVTLVGGAVNLFLAIIKVVFGIIGQSQSLVADGVHSISDLLSDVLVWFAAKHAGEEPDEDHPYGHGRYETAATLGLGIFLVIIAISIIFDAITNLFEPESLLIPEVITLVVATISILTNEALYWYTMLVAKKHNSPMLKANAWHHRSDALSSIIVFIGIAGSILGFIYLDAIAAIIVGMMVAYIGYKLGMPALQELVDKGIDEDALEDLKATIKKVDGVKSLHMLRTRKLGQHFTADLHIQVEPFISVSEGHRVAVAVENAAKNSPLDINDVTVHIDPEDDEVNDASRNLPNRKSILQTLDKILHKHGCKDNLEHIQLHYLSGDVYADIFLPLTSLGAQNSAHKLSAAINRDLAELEHFAKARIFYGNYHG